MHKEQNVLIIDGYGIVFRAYHGQPDLLTNTGQHVGALYGFTAILMKLLQSLSPSHVVVVFDSDGINFRHHLYDQYKANRPPISQALREQLPLVRIAAASMNLQVLEKSGYESDDIIATIVTKLSDIPHKATIISSDKDLMQLINSYTQMFDPIKGRYITVEDVYQKFGVGPGQLREVLALIGDSSDNIPGVYGIGPKTAANLIKQFGSVETLLLNTAQIANSRICDLITSSKDKALLSWQLVGLDTNVDIILDIDALQWTPPSSEQISQFLVKYQFKSLYSRAEKTWPIKIIRDQPSDNPPAQSCNLVQADVHHLNAVMQKAADTGMMSMYIINYQQQRVALLLSVCKENYIFYFTNKANNQDYTLIETVDSTWFLRPVINCLQDKSIKKITLNIKEVYKLCTDFGIDCNTLQSCEDLELMQYALHPGINKKDSLLIMTTHDTLHDTIVSVASVVNNFNNIYINTLTELRTSNTLTLYDSIDLPLALILHQIEKRGVKINIEYLSALSQQFSLEIAELECQIFAAAGMSFNVASPKQLGHVLFEKLQLPFGKVSAKSKNYITDVEALEKLKECGYDIADLLLQWRELTKLKNTYTDSLPTHISSNDQRIHTTLLQTVTTTGRLSSQNPNLQNIPIRSQNGSKIREAFIAEQGCKLISADYSQIELRILSHIANIIALKQAFAEGQDIHTLTACDVFGINKTAVTSQHRRNAKIINFSIIYGVSAFSLAKQLGVTQAEATEYIRRYFSAYKGIEEYMETTKAHARQHGYVCNLLGRRCFVPLINDKNYQLRQFAERAAINAPIQGTNADIIKIAMISVSKRLTQQNYITQLVLQIHDELLFEAPDHEVSNVLPIIKDSMENAVSVVNPIPVDIKVGHNWMQIH